MSNASKRSILQNISQAIASITDMICSSASAVSTTAEVADVIADTGLTLATNTQETTVKQSEGRKQRRLKEIQEEFPELI